MKYIERPHAQQVPHLSLSEQEILIVQNYLLSPGFHSLQVTDVAEGRALLSTFEASLSYLLRAALVNAPGKEMLSDYLPIGRELEAASAEPGQLEQYLLHSWDYDFVAIEGTKELLATEWYGRFEQLLIDYDLIKTMPVLMLFYRQ